MARLEEREIEERLGELEGRRREGEAGLAANDFERASKIDSLA